ncbi:MAG: DUF86 domain-containing protein [Nanoarchaeota archaeon]|nr:DUF86 domain-containing protein [Nanoarchaeota archaeon]
MEHKKRVLAKLAEMDAYLDELEEMLPPEEEYLQNLPIRRACEKTIELAVETVIDVLAIIVAEEKLGFPAEEESLVVVLQKKGFLSEKLSKKIRQMKGFRNIIVHKYGEVDNEQAYEFLSVHLEDFNEFERAIKQYLQKLSKRQRKLS